MVPASEALETHSETTGEDEMPGEVDRLLSWMERVEKLEADLEKAPGGVVGGLICTQLEHARGAQHDALAALVSAAHRGDPEALVALDALEEQIEAMTWTLPRSAA
jgi:hypothetical protein